MSGALWPPTIGSTSTSTCLPRVGELLQWRRGRRVSSEAISTRLRSNVFSRAASLPEVVVLPEPCSPAIITTTGGAALRFSPTGWAPPSISTSPSWTIFDHLFGRLDARAARPRRWPARAPG